MPPNYPPSFQSSPMPMAPVPEHKPLTQYPGQAQTTMQPHSSKRPQSTQQLQSSEQPRSTKRRRSSVHSQPFIQSQSAMQSQSSKQSQPAERNPTDPQNIVMNEKAASMLRPPIATTHEALDLLSIAAGQSEEARNAAAGAAPGHAKFHQRNRSTFSTSAQSTHPNDMVQDDEQRDLDSALQMWSRMRLVKDGWFTATEAMAYVDYYYEHLAPMTPVVIDNYRPHHMHSSLVTDEPILALTIMTIASRHMQLTGIGAKSRAYQIHETLWSNLRGMVQRLVWGQEHFGGGFSSGGAVKTHESKTGQVTWKGSLRTLGTIEALLLLTDWHPRALHFPPGDNENRLLDNDGVKETNDSSQENPLAFSDWLEPVWRSDRMSWMLLGAAVTLSFEVGVFDQNHYICKDYHGPGSECARKQRVRRMVLVFMSQTSGRLGLKPSLNFSELETDRVFEETSREQRQGPKEAVDVMQECWMGIAGLMFKANEEIFPSKQYTSDLTSSGEYVKKIEKFQPLLRDWKLNFDRVKGRFAPVMQHLLSMEYDYARLFINSLGFQKAVESWTNIPKESLNADRTLKSGDIKKGGVSFLMLLDLIKPNKPYIDEVAGAAQNMLETVMEGLVPGGHLVYASVRSYFRILPALIFTMKVSSSHSLLLITNKFSVLALAPLKQMSASPSPFSTRSPTN